MIIGIGGCSNSGKSLLAEQIFDFFSKEMKVKILCQDDYVKRRDFLSIINGHVDWELPSTIELNSYMNSVHDAINTFEVVICEGLFAFWFERLTELFDKKIYLEIDEKTFKKRKREDLRWGREPDWYIDHIWRSHLRYGQTEKHDINTLFTDAIREINFKKIIQFIQN